MAIDFASILADSSIPDNIEFELGGRKVTLGDVRDLSRRERQQISERLSTLDREREEVKRLANQAAEVITRMDERKSAMEAAAAVAAVSPTPNAALDEFDTDPYFAPVRNRIKPLESQLKDIRTAQEAALKELKAQQAQQQSALEKAAQIFASRMFREDYRDVKDRLKGDKYKEYRDPLKLAEYAAKNQLIDENGFPSVYKAVDALTREDEIERIRSEARAEGRKEGVLEGRMANMPRPTSNTGGRGSTPKGLDPDKNFEDLGDSVAEDPELMAMLSQLGVNDVQ